MISNNFLIIILLEMIKLGADADIETEKGTALTLASSMGVSPSVFQLILSHTSNPNHVHV